METSTNSFEPTKRFIRSLLVANRGEIASRILSSARELSIKTYSLHTENDALHTYNSSQAIKLQGPSSYMNVSELIQIVKEHKIDAIHPGYGFLSESPEFLKRMWEEAGAVVVGPGWETLDKTGDKLKARDLAENNHVPVLPALGVPTNSTDSLKTFATRVGYPIMVKAVDGGGGRGIRLIRSEAEMESSARRAIEESPSKQVFAEKAAIDGFRHIEVQIVGDGTGDVRHLWERECSIQRRYQKVIELAPSSLTDRNLISNVIDAALRMAKAVSKRSYEIERLWCLVSGATSMHCMHYTSHVTGADVFVLPCDSSCKQCVEQLM